MSFDDKIKSGKKRNQSTKDRLRDQIRTTLRTEDLDYWGYDGEQLGPIKEDGLDWVEDVVDADHHTFKFVLLNNDEQQVTITATNIDSANNIMRRDYKGSDPMWIEYDGKPVGGFGGIEPRANKYIKEDNQWGGTGRDLELRGHRQYDKDVYVHRNLNAPPYFSIKKSGGATGGKVIGYDTSIHLRDVKFIVGERGNQQVRGKEFGGEGKAKNVHAGAVGKHVASGSEFNTEGWTPVRYNPRKGHETFIIATTEEPIHSAKEAILKNSKEVWVKL